MTKNAVVYTVGGAHIQLTATSLASLIDHYESPEKLDVFIVAEGVIQADITLIRELPELYHKPQINVFVWQKPAILKQLKHFSSARYSEVTVWRLFVPAQFPSYEQILAIDNDTVVMHDVTPLFSLNKPGNVVAAVPDFYYQVLNPAVNKDVLPTFTTMRDYFNAGVLVINVALYNELFSPEMLIDRVDHDQFLYPDQTLLNELTLGKVTHLPYRYNFQKDDDWLNNWARGTDPAVTADMEAERSQVVIRHFLTNLGGYRPWSHLAVMDEFEAAFWQYFSQTRRFFTKETERLDLHSFQ